MYLISNISKVTTLVEIQYFCPSLLIVQNSHDPTKYSGGEHHILCIPSLDFMRPYYVRTIGMWFCVLLSSHERTLRCWIVVDRNF